MRIEIIRHLGCPVCESGLEIAEGGVMCRAGHRFDFARQGYLNLLNRRSRRLGDTAEMVSARAQFLGAGHYRPLASAVLN